MGTRKKDMSLKEFEKVLEKNWVPMEIVNADLPLWTQNIPAGKIHSIYASGSLDMSNPEKDGNKTKVNQIGGMDVYRFAEPKDGVLFNKDFYQVILDPEDGDNLLVLGPFKDKEHWISNLPERLKHALVEQNKSSM